MIHETVDPKYYEYENTAELAAAIKRDVLPIIQGKQNAKTSDAIARMIKIRPSQTNVDIRKAMKELLIEQRIAVLSCSAGFFVATTREEVVEYQDNLRARIQGLNRDLIALNDLSFAPQRNLF